MSDQYGKRIWLIGASEGLGRALAGRLAAEGAQLVLSARNAARLQDLAADLPGAEVAQLDVTDLDAVRHVAAQVGPVDSLIYNVGAYEPMAATEWDSDAALMMVDVNFTGALRVLGEVLPQMVARGAGEITLIGSLAGYRGLPKAVGYGASKAALISLAETLRHDLKGTGVIVRIVNPGFIRTRLTDKNRFKMPQLMSAETAADHVCRALRSRRLRHDFPTPFSWGIRLIHHLPDWLVYRGR